MGQERLISLMMINVEQSLIHCVNFEDIIDSFANSPLLRKFNIVKICKNLLRDVVFLVIGPLELLMF